MSVIGAYARALAVRTGFAQPVASVRHIHLAEAPLVLVPLRMAGEANAPLAAMAGTDELSGTLLVVPQPRDRDLRFAFAGLLGDLLLGYVERCAAAGSEPVKPPRTPRQPAGRPLPDSLLSGSPSSSPGGAGGAAVAAGPEGTAGAADGDLRADEDALAAAEATGPERFLDAPQVLVPNRAGVEFARLFGRSTRFRSTLGEYAVPAGVPLLGRWLTFLAQRAEHPGSSALVAMTEALTLHWATGQSALEDANLAALMAWIDPPDGLSGPEAARLAEDPRTWPPAGPTTDPQFDNRVLAPAIAAYDEAIALLREQAGLAGAPDPLLADPDVIDSRFRAADLGAARVWPGAPDAPVQSWLRARDEVERAVRGQIEPTWRLMWRAVRRLRELPDAASVPRRWEQDRTRFTSYYAYLRDEDGGLPQARRDGAVAAARRLAVLERELAAYEADQAFDDPLVLANQRVTGDAFVGTVVAAERDRRIANERGTLVTRPLVEVVTVDPVRLPIGTKVCSPARVGQTGVIMSLEPAADGLLVSLELSGGMGRAKVPPPGSVPDMDEVISYTSVLPDGAFSAALPAPEDTPWTHGGPPTPYEPTDGDAEETWA
ncbi:MULTISPECIES: hypothetical protein [unclassified Pseudofrankia]|uniref:hypothetical protein n=1 Tax=unclassified Pseudofrankia TaxID=2994372 RepID=UPI0008DAC3E0|nr:MULTISPECIES: hypothetical protein [unclassified Pseudofrankia]MDT3440389.1 hypothetical protein [Pseudofrankia sp. BMG5.37]OHV60824.1 hypothetical protein BCD48_40365 [Pseudofrankia sp. BMG5.36]